MANGNDSLAGCSVVIAGLSLLLAFGSYGQSIVATNKANLASTTANEIAAKALETQRAANAESAQTNRDLIAAAQDQLGQARADLRHQMRPFLHIPGNVYVGYVEHTNNGHRMLRSGDRLLKTENLPLIQNFGNGPAVDVKFEFRATHIEYPDSVVLASLNGGLGVEPFALGRRVLGPGESSRLYTFVPKFIRDDLGHRIVRLRGEITMTATDMDEVAHPFSALVEITVDYKASPPTLTYQFSGEAPHECFTCGAPKVQERYDGGGGAAPGFRPRVPPSAPSDLPAGVVPKDVPAPRPG